MKKYLQKQANVETHQFRSDWCFLVDDGDPTYISEVFEYTDEDTLHNFFDDAKRMVENDFNEVKSHLIEIANERGLDILDMDFKLNDDYTAIMTVKLEEEASEQTLHKISKYLTGQYSDGWGEGLEQRQAATFPSEIDCGYEDEETGEYIEDYESTTGYVFVRLYPKNFRMSYS